MPSWTSSGRSTARVVWRPVPARLQAQRLLATTAPTAATSRCTPVSRVCSSSRRHRPTGARCQPTSKATSTELRATRPCSVCAMPGVAWVRCVRVRPGRPGCRCGPVVRRSTSVARSRVSSCVTHSFASPTASAVVGSCSWRSRIPTAPPSTVLVVAMRLVALRQQRLKRVTRQQLKRRLPSLRRLSGGRTSLRGCSGT